MPKRNDEYMAAQRLHILDAIIELMFEIGPLKLSLRSICVKASISMGAFYVHYKNKDQALEAAIEHFIEKNSDLRIPNTWEEFEAILLEGVSWKDYKKRMENIRVYHELLAYNISSNKKWKWPALSMSNAAEWYENTLHHLHKNGEIAPSTSIENIARQVMIILMGSNYGASMAPEYGNKESVAFVLSWIKALVGRN